jgi:hypothetical protein
VNIYIYVHLVVNVRQAGKLGCKTSSFIVIS